MTATASSQIDAAMVRDLVEEVLRRLGATGHVAPAAGDGPAGAAVLTESVIALSHVERLPPGTTEVVVNASAVVTPSARDRARERGIAVLRSAAPSGGGVASSTLTPFVIAEADLSGNAAGGRAAAIARAVPGAERLPAARLSEVMAVLAARASRDAIRGILLTSRPALAVVLANRSPSVRAVTGHGPATLAAAAAECGANLLVVDPATFGAGLERSCADFARGPTRAPPAELARAAAGCACQTHPH